jgi:hypothetical protein
MKYLTKAWRPMLASNACAECRIECDGAVQHECRDRLVFEAGRNRERFSDEGQIVVVLMEHRADGVDVVERR